jgi:ribosomal protein L39E
MEGASLREVVEERLRAKERLAKEKKCSRGVPITQEEKEYMTEHRVLDNQVRRADPEDNFSFSPPLWSQRLSFVSEIILKHQCTTVSSLPPSSATCNALLEIVDLGCGSGKFISYMRFADEKDRVFYGIDIDEHELRGALSVCEPYMTSYIHPRLHSFDIHLLHGSALIPDDSLRDKDALVCIEVSVSPYVALQHA